MTTLKAKNPELSTSTVYQISSWRTSQRRRIETRYEILACLSSGASLKEGTYLSQVPSSLNMVHVVPHLDMI